MAKKKKVLKEVMFEEEVLEEYNLKYINKDE